VASPVSRWSGAGSTRAAPPEVIARAKPIQLAFADNAVAARTGLFPGVPSPRWTQGKNAVLEHLERQTALTNNQRD
jgi:hypothetical protein